MNDIEKLLRAALAQIPSELKSVEMEEGDKVADIITAIAEALDDGDVEFAYEELEGLGVEFDMPDAFREALSDAAVLLNE